MLSAVAALRRPEVAGSALALLACALLACQDATVKSLLAHYSVWQILCVRSGFIIVACLLARGPRQLRDGLVSPVRGLVIGRGLVCVAAWLCYFTAARTLPLSQLTTLYLAAPLAALLLAAPLLGERIGTRGWLAVVLGSVGTAAACEPAQFAATSATLLVLVGAVLWACGTVMLRRVGQRESTVIQLLSDNLLFFGATLLGSLRLWHMPEPRLLLPLLGMGLLAGAGQLCMIQAAHLAPVRLTAPLQYTGLLWAFLLGFVIWGAVPSPGVSVGAICIVSAGVMILQQGARGAARDVPPPPRRRALRRPLASA